MATPGKPREMSLEEARKRWNGERNFVYIKAADDAAWNEFQRLVGQARETALEVGVIKIKSPGVVGATTGQRFIINKQFSKQFNTQK